MIELGDDDIIELTDVVKGESDLPISEEVIELTDVVKGESDLPISEEVIELTDIAEDDDTNLDIDITKEDDSGLDINDAEDIDSLNNGFENDVNDLGGADDAGLEEEDLVDSDSIDLELEENDGIDAIEDKSKLEPEVQKVVSEDINIDQVQIEAILERIIEKKFADKIESILFEVMENVIEKQIIEIKDSLQKDLEQIGNN